MYMSHVVAFVFIFALLQIIMCTNSLLVIILCALPPLLKHNDEVANLYLFCINVNYWHV